MAHVTPLGCLRPTPCGVHRHTGVATRDDAVGIHDAIDGRAHGPILINAWGNRMRRHNVAAMLVRLARAAGIDAHVTPHALRRSYITIGLLQGVRGG